MMIFVFGDGQLSLDSIRDWSLLTPKRRVPRPSEN